MAVLVISVLGDDRAGLVHSLAAVVTANGGNWERSEMAQLAGKFAGIVTVTVPDADADALVAALRPLTDLLDVAVQRADEHATTRLRHTVHLHLIGSDRPGIINEISGVLARHGWSVDVLRTQTYDAPMSGGRLFEVDAVVETSSTADLADVRADLEHLANELMVDLRLDE